MQFLCSLKPGPAFLAVFTMAIIGAAMSLSPTGMAYADTASGYAGATASLTGCSNTFSTPDNATGTTTANYATTTADGACHGYGTFAISIPAGSAVNGISVTLLAKSSVATGGRNFQMALTSDGGNTFTTYQSTAALTTTDAYYTLGSTSDLWGRTWTPSDFSTFALKITSNISGASKDPFSRHYPGGCNLHPAYAHADCILYRYAHADRNAHKHVDAHCNINGHRDGDKRCEPERRDSAVSKRSASGSPDSDRVAA